MAEDEVKSGEVEGGEVESDEVQEPCLPSCLPSLSA
jgi:hypothetical protein